MRWMEISECLLLHCGIFAESIQGHLVLVDQSYVGALDDTIPVHEDSNVERGGKNPIVTEYDGNSQSIRVHSVTPEEQDWLLHSTNYLRRVAFFQGVSLL